MIYETFERINQKKIFDLSLLSGIFLCFLFFFITIFQFMPRYDLNIFWCSVADFYCYNFFNLILGLLSYLVYLGLK